MSSLPEAVPTVPSPMPQACSPSPLSTPQSSFSRDSWQLEFLFPLGGRTPPPALSCSHPSPLRALDYSPVFIFQQTAAPTGSVRKGLLEHGLPRFLHLVLGRLAFPSFLTSLRGHSHFYVPEQEHSILPGTNSHFPGWCRLDPYLEWKKTKPDKTKQPFKANINCRHLASTH